MATLPKPDEGAARKSGAQLISIGQQHREQAADLIHALSRSVKGEVRFDAASRSLYATDLSIYRQVPIGVVIPRDADDVMATVAACREFHVPIFGRGCGTSLAGQCCNVAVVIDFSKYMNRIREIDPENRVAWVEPGVICDDLRLAAKQHDLTLAPDPATHKYCTLGGMIGNNSCGAHSMMGGKTVDNIQELEILTYDGTHARVGKTMEEEFNRILQMPGRISEIYSRLRRLRDQYAAEVQAQYPRIPRRVSGYNLDELLPENGFHVARSLVGSESTLALILSAKVQLIPNPPKRALLAIGYPDLGTAGDHVPEILRFHPIGLEAFHKHVIENMRKKGKSVAGAEMLPEGNIWLLVEFGGENQKEANSRAEDVQQALKKLPGDQKATLFEEEKQQDAIWHIRESGVGASRVPGEEEAWPSWEDSAVAPEKLGGYLRDFSDLVTKQFNYPWTVFGHFGQGCIHSRIGFDLKTKEGVAKFRRFLEAGADLVVRYGGSLSGEHGDGQARAELLPKMYGPKLIEAFREFKLIWDPERKMNPGKLVDPNPLDRDIRVGPDYHARPVFTHFHFPDDKGSFALATERCFGVGKCRSLDGDTMCPSFHVTREEKHTTRGRAHLLFEMLRGDSILEGWRDKGVKEALDLCLSCKGCKHDCPVSVDMATYKSEFLSHYWEGRLRPRSAYALGLVNVWMRAASFAPGLLNLVTQSPVLRDFAKLAAAMPKQRSIPAIAPRSFRSWFATERRMRSNGRPRVLLWPDTFNNYFHPEIAQAGVDVLEAAGFDVNIPEEVLCCGRPLYDFGMLGQAKTYLRRILRALRDEIAEGMPVIFLEPSCAAVFRDEMLSLLPDDEDAKNLSRQSFLLSEFLAKKATHFELPKFHRKAVVHGHCHHKSILKFDAENEVMDKLGLDYEVLDSGCCGMAGSFGFEKDKYRVSIACGERVLLPAVRKADPKTLMIADGFSCREQIAQMTNRHALHLAQVIQMALRQTPENGQRPFPEGEIVARREKAVKMSIVRAAAMLAGAAAIGGTAWFLNRRSA